MWGATAVIFAVNSTSVISIHAPRVGRDDTKQRLSGGEKISIHAPRVGRDKYAKCAVKYKDISIHAPRVGRDYSYLHS